MNTKQDVSRRFIEAYNMLKKEAAISDQKDFARRIGISASLVTEVSKGRSNVGMQAIQNLVGLYGFSADWLLLGEGEPRQAREAADGCVRAVATGGIPLIPVDAMAGFCRGEATVLEYECERYQVPMFRGADFLIPVRGDSMEPRFRSGDIVACKSVPPGDLFFQWGRPYVVDTDQGPLLKCVARGSSDDTVTLVSANEAYAPFEVQRDSIRHLALVLGIIRLE